MINKQFQRDKLIVEHYIKREYNGKYSVTEMVGTLIRQREDYDEPNEVTEALYRISELPSGIDRLMWQILNDKENGEFEGVSV